MAVASSAGLVLTVHLTIVPHLQKFQQQPVRLCCLKIVVHTGNKKEEEGKRRRGGVEGESGRGKRNRKVELEESYCSHEKCMRDVQWRLVKNKSTF